MADPVTPIILGGIGAATSLAGAQAQNAALRRAGRSQAEAGRVQATQSAAQAEQERQQNRRVRDQVAARTRVLSIASGGGGGDTRSDLLRTVALDAGRNAATTDMNEAMRLAAIRSGVASNLAQLQSQVRSPLLDTIGAGLSGFTTGLQIRSYFSD